MVLLSVGDLYEEVLVRVSAPPLRGVDTAVRSARVRGGSAANVAALAAELGESPRFVGQVGDDALGRTLVDDLRRRGVDAMVHHAGGTGVAVTMIGGGARSRLVDRGASRRLHAVDPDLLDGVTQIYIAASAFTEDPLASAVDRLLGEVRERRIDLTIGGPGSGDLQSIGRAEFLELVRTTHPDTVILNSAEHATLGLDGRSPVPGCDNTVITAGPRPTLVLDHHGTASAVEVHHVDKIRDLTGAGDGFIAGYLSSRHTGADAVSATNAGHRVAAKVIRRLGPTTLG